MGKSPLFRLKHYFLTYKQLPSQAGDHLVAKRSVQIVEMYDSTEAQEVIMASMKDYQRHYGQGPAPKTKARGRAKR